MNSILFGPSLMKGFLPVGKPAEPLLASPPTKAAAGAVES